MAFERIFIDTSELPREYRIGHISFFMYITCLSSLAHRVIATYPIGHLCT
jgi:hypothetical protein